MLSAMHHCYRLHFVVQPGGSRKTEYYVLGTLDEVKAAALEDLNSPEGAYHALLYGEDILLQCWEDGRKVATIDLHPYITYKISERGRERVVTFPDLGDDAPLDMDEIDEDDEGGATLSERFTEGEVTATATLDWERVPVPAMKGTPLPPGTTAILGGDEWRYGFHGEWDCYVD
jgi:hypothetical protein